MELRRWRQFLYEVRPEWLAAKLRRATCKILGCVVIDDQCGYPEHRFCAYCSRPAPNEPVR